jgi:hypothetical protein
LRQSGRYSFGYGGQPEYEFEQRKFFGISLLVQQEAESLKKSVDILEEYIRRIKKS